MKHSIPRVEMESSFDKEFKMRVMQLTMLVVIAGVFTACKPADSDTRAGSGDVASSDDEVAVAEAQAGAEARRPPASAAAPGGGFAREPGFQLPVQVSSTPVRADSIPQSRLVDPVGIRTALIDGMDASGSSIQVQASPTGIVSLSGEVDSIAEMQQAHYLARAQPGVVEVDYRNLRVRRR